ncbi:glycosyltransferase family 2 protein [Sulfurisphaera javensis]|uniref:Glycosyltransferase family 2 protein n=1 Tax=Sulfurisphaera javensis TaxID=2049879 RepID=A0AAT9GU72_9CREN
MNISWIIQFLIFLYPTLFVIYQLFLYKLSFNNNYSFEDIKIKDYPFLSIIVPTKGEKISVIEGLLNNISELEWDKNKMEVIIVSDDTEDYFNEILKKIRIPSGLHVFLYRREKKLGYKSGALLYGYEKSKGDLILTIDVDSRLPKDALIKSYYRMLVNNCDAVALQWVGYSENTYSKLAKGIMASTFFASKALFEGKEKINLSVFPVGSGTLFKRKTLEAVGGWDYNMIQDDLEIGARLINKNKKICSSGVPIYIEVPDNFFSFFIQQTRWAMGTGEVIRNRIKYILTAKVSFIKKIDMLIHLLQYTPIIFTFLGSLLLLFSVMIAKHDLLASPLFLFWGFVLGVYAYIIYEVALKLGFSRKDALFSLGRVSGFTVAISPFIFYYFLKGLLSKKKTYIVTPKGGSKVNTQYKIILVIGIFGIIYTLSAIIYFLNHYYFTAFWLLYYAVGFLYALITFNREL